MLPSMLACKLYLSLIIITVGHAASYTYKGDICDSGSEQSPINIHTNDVYVVPGAQPVVFINYNRTTLNVMVTDHSVRLVPATNLEVGIAAGGLRGFYVLSEIHFHWGAEHTFDGNRFPLEVHFVHYNSIYPDLKSALSDPGGLAVVGVLHTEGSKNSVISEMTEGVEKLKTGSTTAKLDLTPEDFLPYDRVRFFRYHGSLTTPPCSEAVIWTIFKTKRTLSKDQIAWFKNAPLLNGPLLKNYRPVQDIGYRDIELWIASYKNKGVHKTPTNIFMLIVLVLFSYLNQ